jgi:monofunctional biosynthetic peptidoglycan transglycosylase
MRIRQVRVNILARLTLKKGELSGKLNLAKRKPKMTKRLHGLLTGLKASLLRRAKRLVYFAFGLLAVLAAIAIGLTFLYSSSFFHPISTLMAGRIVTGKTVERQWVELENISPVLVHSVMMSEDAKFCAHYGVDWQALNQVIDDAIEGEQTRGASTLSMQTVKNLYLWPGRSYFRKALELPLSLLADAIWSKRRMIEIYLNIAEWGDGIFGIEAAAQHYFSRSAKKLSARQSALLAVSLPNPKKRNPARASKTLARLATKIERRAYQSGAYIKCIE